MKLKNGEIFLAKQPLSVLVDKPFPVLVSYRLAKLATKLNAELKTIELVRMGLLTKHGEKDGDKVTIKNDSPSYALFIEEFNELMDQEVEITLDKVIIPSDGSITLEPRILMALESFVEVTE